jgi:hypothetical protein
MALTKNDLVIGNIVYRLVVNNNAFSRKKIKMVDDAGLEWFRYDIPLWTFRVTPTKFCGTIKQVIRGVVRDGCIDEDQYHMQYLPDKEGKADGQIDYWRETELLETFRESANNSEFFSNEDHAIAFGESICANKNSA